MSTDESDVANPKAVSDAEFSARMGLHEIEEFLSEMRAELALPPPEERFPTWYLEARQERLDRELVEWYRFSAARITDSSFAEIERAGEIGLCQSARGAIAAVIHSSYGIGVDDVDAKSRRQLSKAISAARTLRDDLKSRLVNGDRFVSPFDCWHVDRLDELIQDKERLLKSVSPGRKSKRCGALGIHLLEIYGAAGGTVAFNKKDRKTYDGPFANFLVAVWALMHPNGRPASGQTFVDATKKAWIAKREEFRRRDSSSSL